MADEQGERPQEPALPRISVVVPVLNEIHSIDALLDDLLPQLQPGDELIVVDGGSTDGTLDRLRSRMGSDDRLRLIEAVGTNISAGRNAGIGAAVNGVIACTDVGCRPSRGWLAGIRQAFAADPRPDLVTGVYEVEADGPFEHAMAAACYPQIDEVEHPRPLARLYSRFFGLAFDPTLPTGRSVGFTKEAWDRVGGFPEHLDTSEDITFGRAIEAAGGVCVLEPGAAVVWAQRPDLPATARMYYRYGYGGGQTGDAKLIGRDLLRAAVYPLALASLVVGGVVGRLVVVAGAGVYLSLPLWRSWRRPYRPLTSLLVPAALAVKDVSKATGCVRGLIANLRR